MSRSTKILCDYWNWTNIFSCDKICSCLLSVLMPCTWYLPQQNGRFVKTSRRGPEFCEICFFKEQSSNLRNSFWQVGHFWYIVNGQQERCKNKAVFDVEIFSDQESTLKDKQTTDDISIHLLTFSERTNFLIQMWSSSLRCTFHRWSGKPASQSKV